MSRLNDSELPFSLLQFYATSTYPCSYLPGREARSQVATPPHLISSEIYATLLRAGFRRSGLFVYRPSCEGCHACLPVRLPVERFTPSRSQRRARKKHADLQIRDVPLLFNEEHYLLYRCYQQARHQEAGDSTDDSREQYEQFLLQSQIDTRLVEFREGDTLRMVSLLDVLDDGLSSVYTFYDPDVAGASYGTCNIVWQVEATAALGLPYLYLGYWIAGSRKMDYKARFRPLQGLIDGRWQDLPV